MTIQTECFKDEHIYTVNEEISYILEWTKGTLLSSGYCDVQFHAKGEETLDDYKVCFEALEYSIEDCEVHMQYRDTTNLPYDKVLRSDISIRQLPCPLRRLGNNVAPNRLSQIKNLINVP